MALSRLYNVGKVTINSVNYSVKVIKNNGISKEEIFAKEIKR